MAVRELLIALGTTFLSTASYLLGLSRTYEAIGTGALGIGCIALYAYLVEHNIEQLKESITKISKTE